ncbi:MAG: DUF4252 domain-containing protein [Lewinellaceae bacterium]|nr:DUF4252 domain-containing protein [Saprospiraceae bacterium]MCB9340882.1 DUF4252 domain-containing protein [Lewinellaceae bacterium]
MKNILLAIVLLALPAAAFSQTRALNKFYRQNKKGADVQNIKLPGWLIRFGGKIAKNAADDPEEKLALDLLRKFGTTRFMYAEDGAEIPQKAIEKLRKDLREDSFDDLIMIRSGEMNFDLMIREKDGRISEIVMFYNDREEGEMAFISAKTKLTLDDIKALIKTEVKKELKPIIEEPEEEPVAAEPIL